MTTSVCATASLSEIQTRVAALEAMAVLDTPPEEGFDALTRMAAIVCETPIAIVSLIDGPRLWFKSVHGLSTREIDSECSFCSEAANSKQRLEVQDALLDPRFVSNGLVTGSLGIRYYAAAPVMYNGVGIGTVCVLDYVPRILGERTLRALSEMANIAAILLSARIDAFRLFSATKN